MRLLIIGGTGVLSLAITKEAISKGIDVYMINRGNRKHLVPDDVHLLLADIHDHKKIEILIKGLFFDAVIDCLCFTESQLIDSYHLFHKITHQYIFISSCAVYNTEICSVCKEDSPKVLPVWEYSIDKNACEERLISLAEKDQVNYTIIRPCVTYGNTRIPYGITPPYGFHWTIVERILHGKPIIKWNSGKNCCNIMRVEDFAVGVVGLLGNKKAYNEAFNIVGDEVPSWNDVLLTLENLLGKKVVTVDIPSSFYAEEIPIRRGEILGGRSIDAINSNEKIKSVVPEFRQTITLKDGIARTLKYYENNSFIYGIDYAFDAETDRIITKYVKRNNIDFYEGNNFSYIDYLNEKKWINKYTYYINRYTDKYLLKILTLGSKILLKIWQWGYGRRK